MPDVLEMLKVLASFLIYYYFFQVSENNPLIGMTQIKRHCFSAELSLY